VKEFFPLMVAACVPFFSSWQKEEQIDLGRIF
jgi:hypothetical protein